MIARMLVRGNPRADFWAAADGAVFCAHDAFDDFRAAGLRDSLRAANAMRDKPLRADEVAEGKERGRVAALLAVVEQLHALPCPPAGAEEALETLQRAVAEC